MNNWDIKFLELSDHISNWSKDKHTKVGAVIVNDSNRIVSTGYNGMPIGADDSILSRYSRENKYFYFEHAERNAIYSAADKGDSTRDSTIYINNLHPCADCARAIIQARIKRVVCSKPVFDHERWGKSWTVANELFVECGVEVIYFK